MRKLHFIFTWTTLVIFFEAQHDVNCEKPSVFYDEIDIPSTPIHHLSQSKIEDNGRENGSNKEQPFPKVFNPMRIKPFFFLSSDLLQSEKVALENVLMKAILKISKLLSVISLSKPLLLLRKACLARKQTGPNKGKCTRMIKRYSGERCLDNFKIPTEHLKGFAIYNATHPKPVKVFKKNGPGVEDTDFVLYVTSINTQLCNPHTALHELFHTLGFSNKLFDKYLSCDEARNCTPRSDNFILWFETITRMATPAVVREMRKQFDCQTATDFGGPLGAVNDRATSHWDPLLMHSSLMTSKEQKPYLTLIDRVTLAVFEDTGWYKVNYSQADKFTWGKGQGCQFGFPSLCKHQQGFCTKNITGCHYMRLSKARCVSNISPFSECGLFTADQTPCFMGSNVSTLMPDEVISPSSRCFVSSLISSANLTSNTTNIEQLTSGRCYERKCADGKMLVRINQGNWISCFPGSYVQIENFHGSIECPTYDEVCTDFHVERDEIITVPLSQHDVIDITPQAETIGRTKLSAEIHLISSTPLKNSLLVILQETLRKNTSESYGWRTNAIEKWARKNRNQFHTHFCLSISSLSKESIDRGQVRKFLSSIVVDTFKADIQHKMIINVNYDNLIACPSSSLERTKENSAIPTFTVPLAAAIGLISAMVETLSWINNFNLL